MSIIRRQIPGRALDPEFVRVVLELEGDALYPPSHVARLIAPVGTEEYDRWRKKTRSWIKYHCKEPNGKKGPYNAWYGATWQQFLDPMDKAALLDELLEQGVVPEWAPSIPMVMRHQAAAAAEVHPIQVPRPAARRRAPLAAMGLAAVILLVVLLGLPRERPIGGDTHLAAAVPAPVITVEGALDSAQIMAESFMQDSPKPETEPTAEEEMSYADFAAIISDREPLKPRAFFHPKLHLIDQEAGSMTLVFNENPKPEQAMFLLDAPIISPP